MTDAELLNVYNLQARLIHSLHMDALMRTTAARENGTGERPHEIPVSIDFLQPEFLRVTGALPFMSSRGFELTSDGREFHLLVPQHGKRVQIVGPVGAPVQWQNQREDLQPQPLIDALRWQEATLSREAKPGDRPSSPAGSLPAGIRVVAVQLPRGKSGARTGRIKFDLDRGEIDSLTIYDPAGRVTLEAGYSDWQQVAGSPSDGCLPRHIRFNRPGQAYEVTLRAYHTVLNPQIPLSDFRFAAPRAIPTIRLDASGKIIHP